MTSLADLRTELTEMLAEIGAASIPRHPEESVPHDAGPPLRIWHRSNYLTLHTMRGEDGRGAVFLTSGDRMPWGDDWGCLDPKDAIAMGNALLAAAADCERDI